MTCSLHSALLPKGQGVAVNGMVIPREMIAREVQHHPSKTPADAWKAAARALVVRELLLQEVKRLNVVGDPKEDSDGRRETEEEAAIRTLFEREVQTPTADRETCRRYYEQNRRSFRSPDIHEAAHILFAAPRQDQEAYLRAQTDCAIVLDQLKQNPERFAELARAHSACPSARSGGNLGQIVVGQTTPEFEQALNELAPGATTHAPIATQYGFHIIRLERRLEGRELPFEVVADRIACYLDESVTRRATAQFIARLAAAATITGISLTNTETPSLN
jgi:peptidyl-prolyl cis-trans isomerase C